ncbi:hypothetical protein [Methanobacterium ferruginis]|uniref:hypothetical protein n=1 Tax=Methanobacterium ferruginis TaxID=710191 RepID=UPI00257293E5|nr:hypothetical protein [Methanobacterium ferruginis]BDZ68883.1 hypothetical protein GCM10025860_23310 [Methanobacterium ferruginis]
MKWLSESFKIIFDENKEALQVIGHAADVTQEKESEKRYKESEKNTELFLNSIQIILFW